MASATCAFAPSTTTRIRPATSFFSSPATTTNAFSEYTQTDDQGLAYQDTVVGTGEVAEKGKVVTVAYKGRMMSNGKQFDQGDGYSFKMGEGQVIQGWDQGVEGMKVGGKRTLRIPPNLAYGDRGAKNVIPPGAHIEFDCELVGIASNPVEGQFKLLNMSPLRVSGLAFFLLVLAISPMFPQ